MLGISWLNGQVRAVARRRGVEGGGPEAVLDRVHPDVSPEVLRQAVALTGFQGRHVTITLAHARLLQFQVEAPPAKGAVLSAYLQAQVERLKSWEEPAVWTAQRMARPQGGEAILLHVLPRSLLEQVTAACGAAGLRLVALVPVPGIMAGQLEVLGGPSDSLVMATADFGGLTSVLVGRPDGRLLTVRTIGAGWDVQPERLLTDLRRTLLYAGQQADGGVAGIWNLAAGVPEALQRLADGLNLRAESFRPAADECFWARAAAGWDPAQAPNFIPKDQWVAARWQALSRLAVLLAGLLALISGAAAAYFLQVSREHRRIISRIETSALELQGTHIELRRLQDSMAEYRASIKALREDALPPVAAWFQAYLAEACPAEIQLTGASVSRETEGWRFRLQGQLASGPDASGRLGDALVQLTDRLSQPPLRAQIQSRVFVDPTGAREPDFSPGGVSGRSVRRPGATAGWRPEKPDRVSLGGRPTELPERLSFQLEGWIQ
jgi:hypothetical protein